MKIGVASGNEDNTDLSYDLQFGKAILDDSYDDYTLEDDRRRYINFDDNTTMAITMIEVRITKTSCCHVLGPIHRFVLLSIHRVIS